MKAIRNFMESVIRGIRGNTLLIGIASLIWLLYRSGTNPARLRYPCQQACMANVSLYLSPVVLLAAQRIIRAREKLTLKSVTRAVLAVSLILLLFLFADTVGGKLFRPGILQAAQAKASSAAVPQSRHILPPNRVVSVHDSKATNWDYQTGYYWQYIDQKVVDDMVAQGVEALTGKDSIKGAWKDLIPYKPGDDIAIKCNFNNSQSDDYNNKMDVDAETVNAVVAGLQLVGVPPEHIWITDPSKVVPKKVRERMRTPGVQFASATGSKDVPNYHIIDYVEANSPDASVAQCPAGEKIRPSKVLVDAEHLINIPLLKSHIKYITGALKNHYGSVIYKDNDRWSMHAYFEEGGKRSVSEMEQTNILADINNNPNIRDKTRLILGDGLFGNPHGHLQPPERWAIFGNDDPNMLFFSRDPVALDSVMMDYIVAERGPQEHEHLHAAMALGLGVHDHWDSFEHKHYHLIDYKIIGLDKLLKPGA
jgi:uncharacterized protein (DUF362 family)